MCDPKRDLRSHKKKFVCLSDIQADPKEEKREREEEEISHQPRHRIGRAKECESEQ